MISAVRCPRFSTSCTSKTTVKAVATDVTAKDLYQQYLTSVEPERRAFVNRRSAQQIMAPDENKALALAFLIYISARGVRMTEPVEDWVRRAGERCLQLGMTQMGNFLVHQSREEANHHLMYMRDTRNLAARWNNMYPGNKVDAERLLKPGHLNPGEHDYTMLHEDVIKSELPFGQIAIQNEIERIAVVFLPKLIAHLEKCFGDCLRDDLSFFDHHMTADIGHSDQNEAELIRLFSAFPQAIDDVAHTGTMALRAFGDYMDDCLVLAYNLVGSSTNI